MAEPDVDLKGLLERNTPGLGHTTSYRLDNVTIEVDLSEVGDVDESLAEGLPVTVNGHFETQDNPETGARWVFKAHSLHRMSQAVERRSPVPRPPPKRSEADNPPPEKIPHGPGSQHHCRSRGARAR